MRQELRSMSNYELLSSRARAAAYEAEQESDDFPFWILAMGMALVGGFAGWVLAPQVMTWLARLGALVVTVGDEVAWHLTRSMATVGYVSLTGAAVWGLLLSTKLVKSTVPAPLSLALHSVLSWLGVALGGL